MIIKSIAIFCGAHLGADPDFEKHAILISKLIAKQGIDIVYGGGNVGLMKTISDTAINHGAKVTGITLKSLHEFELSNPKITETLVTNNLFERKEKFLELSDAFIVLPGGVGSMDELLEVMVSNQLGIINKPVGVLNLKGYYDGFVSWLKKSVELDFVTQANLDEVIFEDDAQILLEKLLNKEQPDNKNWIDRLNINQ
tara:strand:- start:40148 stop:40741 length:594 start_codon:yes stop_codon:yes gene_type:complete